MLDNGPQELGKCSEPDWEATMERMSKQHKASKDFIEICHRMVDAYGAYELKNAKFFEVLASTVLGLPRLEKEMDEIAKKIEAKF